MRDWIKDLFHPIWMFHPRFGLLRYIRDTKFWQGKASFKATGREVDVMIPAPVTGPTDDQCSFLAEVESRYETLWPTVKQKILLEAQGTRASRDVEFELVCVNIPEAPGPDARWQLHYKRRRASGHVAVSFQHWEPSHVRAEN